LTKKGKNTTYIQKLAPPSIKARKQSIVLLFTDVYGKLNCCGSQ
jgi:hypothetical protein